MRLGRDSLSTLALFWLACCIITTTVTPQPIPFRWDIVRTPHRRSHHHHHYHNRHHHRRREPAGRQLRASPTLVTSCTDRRRNGDDNVCASLDPVRLAAARHPSFSSSGAENRATRLLTPPAIVADVREILRPRRQAEPKDLQVAITDDAARHWAPLLTVRARDVSLSAASRSKRTRSSSPSL